MNALNKHKPMGDTSPAPNQSSATGKSEDIKKQRQDEQDKKKEAEKIKREEANRKKIEEDARKKAVADKQKADADGVRIKQEERSERANEKAALMSKLGEIVTNSMKDIASQDVEKKKIEKEEETKKKDE